MKKTHFILLVISAVMALFSVYSLAIINQVYRINFSWYSELNDRFVNQERNVSGDKWMLSVYPESMVLEVIPSIEDAERVVREYDIKRPQFFALNYKRWTMLYCSLGEVNSPDYRIKVVDIVQRENVVEVKVSLNSPREGEENRLNKNRTYMPEDIVIIDNSAFPVRGKLYFIFKDQAGRQISEKVCYID